MEQVLGKNQELNFGHFTFEIPFRHPNGNEKQAIEYIKLCAKIVSGAMHL